MTKISRFLSILSLTLFAATSQAQTTLITEPGEGEVRTDYLGTYGLVFITDRELTVRSLGFYDHGGDGLTQEHWVGIGSGSGGESWPFLNSEIVGQVTIPGGTAAHYEDGFRWVNLAVPITLQAGVYYSLAGQVSTPLDPLLLDDYPAGTFLFSDAVTGAAGRYRAGSWGNPSNQVNDQIFIVANLSEKVMGIPEPRTTVIMVLGIALMAFVLRKRAARMAGRDSVRNR
ncbi:MAG TPA: PEP-CTERM sorting domain-containing protein [Chthoniobacteraceae bacterium]|nr:PEP-CTERM sorting domain-containing protein [Chthoniobacteraceae bacterium]